MSGSDTDHIELLKSIDAKLAVLIAYCMFNVRQDFGADADEINESIRETAEQLSAH